jgi:hypothetical protein
MVYKLYIHDVSPRTPSPAHKKSIKQTVGVISAVASMAASVTIFACVCAHYSHQVMAGTERYCQKQYELNHPGKSSQQMGKYPTPMIVVEHVSSPALGQP